jgi:hypothetical protein
MDVFVLLYWIRSAFFHSYLNNVNLRELKIRLKTVYLLNSVFEPAAMVASFGALPPRLQLLDIVLCHRGGLTIRFHYGSLVVKALDSKPEDRGLENQRGEILHLPNPSGRTRPWGLFSL